MATAVISRCGRSRVTDDFANPTTKFPFTVCDPGGLRLGIVTGLAFEAAILGTIPDVVQDGRMVRVAGASTGRARTQALALVDAGAEALLSFGVAGGLDAASRAGDVIVARDVIDMDGRSYPADAAWRGRLVQILGPQGRTSVADMLGVDAPLDTIVAKAQARRITGATAVDMESHAVAEAASKASIPFMALRAVADTHARALPTWSLAAIDSKGRVRMGYAVAGVCRRPEEIMRLPGLARDSRAARRALSRVATLCGPFLGLV